MVMGREERVLRSLDSLRTGIGKGDAHDEAVRLGGVRRGNASMLSRYAVNQRQPQARPPCRLVVGAPEAAENLWKLIGSYAWTIV